MRKQLERLIPAFSMVLLLIATSTTQAGDDVATQFTNSGGVINTRHNLSQMGETGGLVDETQMNSGRNQYGEVCVYCHTPHGANSQLAAPLWNRTFVGNTYTTYAALNTSTLTASVTQPGINSLTCLSCHDGTVGIDSIINMPGSGGYDADREDTFSNALLDVWAGDGPDNPNLHATLDDTSDGCMACHQPGTFAGATDFTVFAIGTDLQNDHPVGIGYPTTRVGDDFNGYSDANGNLAWYDDAVVGGSQNGNGNSRPDKGEIRFYDTGDGYEVECASCHDPHGVPSDLADAGSVFNPSFLRTGNSTSAVCQTCHAK